MDDFALGDFTIADDALSEDCPYVDGCVFAPEFMSNDYVRVTQLYCDGVGMQYKDFTQSERNLEFDICNMWCSKPVSVLQDYCDAIKIYIFWPLLFQRQHSSIISRLHPCVEATNSHASEISLKKLQHLELMEDIVDLAKKVVNDSFFIGGLLRIGYKIENKILAMEEALNWVKYTGDVTILPKLGAVDNCWPMLSIFFTEYKYHITKVVTENCNLLEEFKTQNCAECIEQGELMKMKGNEEFSKERFDIAIIYYTRAIEYRPENHLLYGNRALCFLRTGQFRNALGDGKRATILKSNWTKGHYRYCAALSMLGEYDWALQANIKAQKLCKNDPEGIKDLIQQHVKLQKQIEDLQGRTPTRNPIKAFYESRAYIPSLSAPAFSTSLNFVETEKDSRKTNREMANGGNQNLKVVDEALKVDDCDCHPEFLPPSGQTPKYKGKQKSRNNELEKFSSSSQGSLPVDLKNILEKQFSKSSRAAHQDFANIMKMLRSLIQDGYTALLEQRCRSAAQAFTELLNGLDPQKIKQLNLAMINYVLVVYGLAISLLGIGQPEELSEAENQFKRMIEHYPNEGLDCLAYCGIGKVYLKKNRFLEALNHFEKARTLICRLPGVLTWPTSNVIIEETQPGKIKMLLEKFIEECRFPPVPDAICCYQKCRGYSKIQIYITDPDFKGFIRISCCQYCKIEFHMNCWKKLKTTTFNDKIDKDFLQGICLTPDCEGIISKIIIFSSGGQVKCEFEHKVIKEKVPPRPILKQKCSSLEKLRLKEDKKLKRKIQKKEAKKLAQERMEEDLRESNPPKTEEQKETVDSVQSCQFLDDRILQCIKQYADKIKSGILNTSKLLKELLSWKVLSTEDYTTCFSSRNFLNEAVDYVIRHLIQEKNRVKTRIFLHVLSELKEVEPKLAAWIQKLNSFGLDATGPFFSRYGASLKELDFSIMTFLWNEKYGHKLASIEGKQLDYFCEPTSVKEARCLIWLLEEHRDKFPALHNALDEFFDIMDSRCTVLRKQDSGDVPFNSAKIKNKGKKKKPKDSKPMLVGSGTPSVTPNNETITSGEEHNRRNSNSAGPFVVPDHLRQDVEEFEAIYEQHSSEYVVRNKKLWDINPKQKCSTLYDYFSQLLEEHGPLDMSNKMFSEEYEFFPEETRQILEKAGGLKSFLLGCPRFVVIDNCIALKKVALRLKKKRKKKNIKTKVEEISKTGEYLRVKLPLNPTAREFKPDVKSKPMSDLSSATASENVKPKPVAANSPKSTCEVMKPRPVSDNSSRSVSEDEKPKEVSSDSAQPVSEDASHKRVSSNSPKPASEDVKPAYWTQPHLVTGYCTYLPFRGFDITQTPPTYINVLPTLPQYTNIYTPLPNVSSEYQLQRSVPVVPSFIPSERLDESATVYFEGHHLNAENAPGNQIVPKTQILQDSMEVSVKTECSTDGADTALSESNRYDGHCGNSANKWEVNPEKNNEVTNTPHTQMVAIQVSWNITHQEVNTEPYDPFETQQGDISQIEKEFQVLQEQLNEACENYEQRKLKGSEETRDLEEKLKRNLEENKISKTELDWFLEDLEKEIKKWQQEKKEIQESLKALTKKMRKVLNANEIYAQKNDGKEKEHELLLDQSLEISNTFTNEKMKVEECIKKGKENYEESLQRAVAAEVSVLENWKDIEVYKLQIMESQAEGYLKNLRLLSSDSATYPDKESDIHSWESFLSKVKKEIEKAKSQYEEQIQAIKNGSRLSELSKVQVPELSFPVCSTILPTSLPESSGHEDHRASISTSHEAGNQTAVPKDSSLVSASDGPVGASSPPLTGSLSCQPEVTQLPECKSTGQETPPKQSLVADQKLPVLPGRATRSSQSPKKPFNSIIEHLSVVFPCYNSTELAGFIKKVRNKNKNSLSGLSIDEIVQRVTEHILDEQKKKKPNSNSAKDKRLSEPSSTASVNRASQGPPSVTAGPSPKTKGQKTEDAPASGAASCELCHEIFKSKNVRVLKCGHKFHKGCFKQWLKGQSTCPACLDQDLL
ncbi:E3 ubiquitin-protein ligase TTC3 isoform X1 [Canis lupus baileyi]|uniref:RING-type E3 ubiquitin transferase n=6 Tax=Canis lupus TaxID=9612 RepID=A0A8C0T874_CANLF|nr:E3 ubiquitin-protein ligase TTC3 isoform X1 [Canis lupus familiaris]XP_025305781.1 E3 ubiquitin-protein ligase TTC3 isoform X1 [Canis lupus dingo]XP_025305782.1 E3 ubiquitin-protein ligase TTC3 isoform X1 [Canis lupus dingo]XP_025305783.1 E3 ubiquitin-protein ligase TTC3 isoform X1 [Canis lupus dingo]XP_025305784.1 E3 ubiquitin-protein ligase TTC3 isoform X1 [Canis lupus dingo]XP_038299409.1 E3 ubiquitin-protein ligase TTC3 isoform X1 [Canis lupus familiaris]XP_038299410.1 E3 ubiquitin-pro|eukprot:XP_005638962.1 E3 ubiquitin-protein ligase TTC3 isoform X1 [Canis lupus familiaris]